MNYDDIRPHHAADITEENGITTITVADEFIEEIGTTAVQVRIERNENDGQPYDYAVLSWTTSNGVKHEKAYDRGYFRSRNFVHVFTIGSQWRALEVVVGVKNQATL